MTISEWLKIRMESKGIKSQSDLAWKANVSQTSISTGKRKNKLGNRVLKKLEKVLGPYDPEEEPPKKISLKEFLADADTTFQESLDRFNGNDCPTSSFLCRTCWEYLCDNADSSLLPRNRALCRLKHGWVQVGGILYYKQKDGKLVRSDDL